MTITVEEKAESRESTTGDSASVELQYVIRGTASDIEAKSALGSTAPSVYDGLPRQSRRVSPIFVDVGNPDGSIWEGVARYGLTPRPETGDSEFSFDTGGGTQHITQALAHVGTYSQDPDAPNFSGAIGVADGHPEGVDITVPVYNWQETHYIVDGSVTSAYRADLFWLTGKVNSAAFKGFDAGEVLFMGAQGSTREDGSDWEITFRFAASPNITGRTIGSITGIDKKGWEYLWVTYETRELDRFKVVYPTAVHIEQVYEYGDFSKLNL